MAGRFPGAGNLREFWHNLRNGVESISTFDEEELRAAGVDPRSLEDPRYVPAAGVLDGIEEFDAPLFQMTPGEAELLDPQHRIFLECSWEALEDAGYAPGKLAGSIGVFAGTGLNTYLLEHLLPSRAADGLGAAARARTVIANDKDFLTTRVSYKLDLKGPSVDVQTACSSSLLAVSMACQSLLTGQCDLALAGGVSVRVPQQAGHLFEEHGVLSPDGHCRPFDERAGGTVRGSGAGVAVLKRLDEALAEGDTIRAVVRGSAVNNDGAAKVGFTAPSPAGQADVITLALAAAGLDPRSITYVEAHGTGTALGDPIEIQALRRALDEPEGGPACTVGSVKSNIGHLDAAAGIAGFLKTVLALQHRTLPPTLHLERLNPRIDLAGSRLAIQRTLEPWNDADGVRRAGVSSFGIGGTNVHVVVEEAPALEAPEEGPPWHLLPISARTPEALDRLTVALARHLAASPELRLADVAYTLQAGRKELDARRAVVAEDLADAVALLEGAHPVRVASGRIRPRPPRVAFLFPGQGTDLLDAGRELYERGGAFRERLDACAEVLEPVLEADLREVLYPGADGRRGQALLDETAWAQPALFSIEYALAGLWESWGVRAAALLGHSLGEWTAACLAGVVSLEDALALVAARGRLLQDLEPGAMLAARLPEDELRPLLGESLSVAAVNAPGATVVSGPPEAIAALEGRLEERRVPARRLPVRRAFHSPHVEPAVEAFVEEVSRRALHPPRIPFVSNVTGDWIAPDDATDPAYWGRHLRQTVRFGDGVPRLLGAGCDLLLEVGPGESLARLARRCAKESSAVVTLASLGRRDAGGCEVERLLRTLGKVWIAGVPVRWPALAPPRRRRVPLPTYPFERTRHWVERPGPDRAVSAAGPDGPLSVPVWKEAPAAVRPASRTGASWLVLADDAGLGAAVLRRLEARRETVVAVAPGPGFARLGDRSFRMDPASEDDASAVLAALPPSGPLRVVHLWSLDEPAPEPDGGDPLAETVRLGFQSLQALAGALGTSEDAGRRSVGVDVVTRGARGVAGEAPARPDAALPAGACREIRTRLPGLRFRSIDLDPEGAYGPLDDAEVDALLAELGPAPAGEVVAHRRRRRWVEVWEPMRAPAPPGDRPPAADTGGAPVLLVAGDVSGPGHSLGRELARAMGARVAYLGSAEADREPARSPWTERLPPERIRELERALEATADPREDPALAEATDPLCTSLIVRALARRGVELAPGATWSREELARRLGILPRFERLYDALLRILAEDSVLVGDARLEVLAAGGDVPPPEQVSQEIRGRHPALRDLCRLLEHCGDHLGAVMSGETDPLEVLYGEERPDLFSGAVQEGFGRGPLYRRLLAGLLERALAEDLPRGPLRVLEVGAGHGLLTRALVPVLRGRDVEYHVTDLGRSFVLQAEKRAARDGDRSLRFGVLDVSRDPASQGYATGEFDLVVAANVVHATPRVEDSLRHLRRLLADGGLLALVETVRAQRWATMVWGLTEGWWRFEDGHLRSSGPLLALEGWEDLLPAHGFHRVIGLPEGRDRRRATDAGLLLARAEERPAATTVPVAAGAGASSAAGGASDTWRVDLADPGAVRAALARIREAVGALHGAVYVAPEASAGGGGEELVRRLAAPRTLAAQLRGERLRLFALCSQDDAGGAGPDGAVPAYLRALAAQREAREEGASLALHWRRPDPGGPEPPEEIWRDLAALISDPVWRAAALGGPEEDGRSHRADGLQPTAPAAAAGEGAPSPDGFHERPRLFQQYVAPRDTLEARVARIWEEALGIRGIGVDDNFFELGGDSLLGLQVTHAVRREFGDAGRTVEIFDHPTVSATARVLGGAADPAPFDRRRERGRRRRERQERRQAR